MKLARLPAGGFGLAEESAKRCAHRTRVPEIIHGSLVTGESEVRLDFKPLHLDDCE